MTREWSRTTTFGSGVRCAHLKPDIRYTIRYATRAETISFITHIG